MTEENIESFRELIKLRDNEIQELKLQIEEFKSYKWKYLNLQKKFKKLMNGERL